MANDANVARLKGSPKCRVKYKPTKASAKSSRMGNCTVEQWKELKQADRNQTRIDELILLAGGTNSAPGAVGHPDKYARGLAKNLVRNFHNVRRVAAKRRTTPGAIRVLVEGKGE